MVRRAVSTLVSVISTSVDDLELFQAHNTLFRGNTVFTKTVELLMAWYGKDFLDASIGDTIRRICAENISIEVDPLRSSKGVKDIERNVELLVHWCRQIWNQIYSVRTECPK